MSVKAVAVFGILVMAGNQGATAGLVADSGNNV